MEKDNTKDINKQSRKKKITTIGLSFLLLAFVIYKFALWNYFSIVINMDAKIIVEDFERNYLYYNSLNDPNYTKMRDEIINSPYTTKEKISQLIEYAKNLSGDRYTNFKYADIFSGKFNYSNYERLKFESKSLDADTAYIRINTFANNLDKKFLKNIKKLKDKDYLVLDLRDNNRGDHWQVVQTADALLPGNAEICYIEYLNSKHYYNSDAYIIPFKKIFVLLNEKSGYGAELLALTLKENLGEKVELIGNKSMGKGIGEVYKSYYNKIDFSITTLKWFVKNKSAADLSAYLQKYSNAKLEKLNDYIDIVNSLKK